MMQSITVHINQPIDNNLGNSYQSLLDILKRTQNLQSGDKLIIDLQNINFAYPFLFLPLSALIKHLKYNNIHTEVINIKCSYLNTIRFPDGLNPLLTDNWEDEMNRFQYKSYLPICAIPTDNENYTLRENLISTFEQILNRQLLLTVQMKTCISYLISEALDNVVEHAKVSNGWIMVQNYPSLHFLDVCIADTGRGILGGYQAMGFQDIVTAEQSIQEAINGRSTKYHETSRGYGIRTSRKMLVKGLKGIFLLVSGNAFYYWSSDQELINALDSKYFWPGTILALRIPKSEPFGFNYVKYLE